MSAHNDKKSSNITAKNAKSLFAWRKGKKSQHQQWRRVVDIWSSAEEEKKGWKIMFDLKLKTWPHPSGAKQRENDDKNGKWRASERRENSQHSQIILFENQLNCNLLCCVCVVGSYQQHLTLTLSHLTPILIFSPEHCNVLKVLQYSLNDDNRFYWMTISPTAHCDSTGKGIYNFDLRNSRKCRHPAGVRTMSVNNVDRAAIVNCLWFSISHSSTPNIAWNWNIVHATRALSD